MAETPRTLKQQFEQTSAPVPLSSVGTAIISEPPNAEVWLDHHFVENIPVILKLSGETHLISVKAKGHADWIKSITVLKDSEVRLTPVFE
jgi:PEGA domain-containing protein